MHVYTPSASTNNLARQRRRAARRALLAYQRPRCIICDKPINWFRPDITEKTTTCSKPCAKKRWNWFKRKPR